MNSSTHETLAVPPVTLHFSSQDPARGETAFRTELVRQHQKTLRLKIARPEDVLLHNNLRVQGRFQLTTAALSALCKLLAPGLSEVVYFLAGLRKPGERYQDPDEEHSELHEPLRAATLLNDFIRLRFRQVRGYQLITDQQRHVIEGVVGRKYAFLPNAELYRDAINFFRDADEPFEFHSATLHGRRLAARLRSPQPWFRLRHPEYGDEREERFHGGIHLANSEIGECAIHAAAFLVRQPDDQLLLASSADGGKLIHIRGPTFQQKLLATLNRARQQGQQLAQLQSQVQRLMTTRLGLGRSQIQHVQQFGKLVQQLRRRGVPGELAETIMNRVVTHGSYQSARLGGDVWDLFGRRTAFDLVCALSEEAKQHRPALREKLESLAYQVLSGQIVVS